MITLNHDGRAAPGAPTTGRDTSGRVDRPSPGSRALTRGEFTAVAVVAALVTVLGVLGFVNSFAAIAAAAHPSFGRLDWTVPLGIDLGIAIFSALDIVLARLDMRVRWLRLVPWALTATTVYLNVVDQPGAFGMVGHAALPALWVVAVEVAAHVIRIRAGIAAGTRIDRIRVSRWVLAPWPTLRLWRRMVLWEIRSYSDALARERTRVLALTDLQDAYGRWRWRRHAPRRLRALYRLGELTPAPLTDRPHLVPVPEPVTVPASADTDPVPGAVPETSSPAVLDGSGERVPARPAPRTRSGGDPAEVRAVSVFAEDIAAGQVPSIRRIKATLRCGQAKASQVRTYLASLDTTPQTRVTVTAGKEVLS